MTTEIQPFPTEAPRNLKALIIAAVCVVGLIVGGMIALVMSTTDSPPARSSREGKSRNVDVLDEAEGRRRARAEQRAERIEKARRRAAEELQAREEAEAKAAAEAETARLAKEAEDKAAAEAAAEAERLAKEAKAA
jgi:hypothetical protein